MKKSWALTNAWRTRTIRICERSGCQRSQAMGSRHVGVTPSQEVSCVSLLQLRRRRTWCPLTVSLTGLGSVYKTVKLERPLQNIKSVT